MNTLQQIENLYLIILQVLKLVYQKVMILIQQ